MTQLDKIKRAKMYMDKLANGINPIDDTAVPDEDIINSVRLSRCFFFVSDILRQVIDSGGLVSSAEAKEPKKQPFFLPYEKRALFPFSETPVTASEIAKRLNDLADQKAMKKITYATVTSWLLEVGALRLAALASGKERKYPTSEGVKLGITEEERTGAQGPYHVVVYDTQAQHFILDNLDAILESERSKTEMQGMPWTQAHDDCLRDLYEKDVPLSEIAVSLKRNKSSVRARLKKLGLLEKSTDI